MQIQRSANAPADLRRYKRSIDQMNYREIIIFSLIGLLFVVFPGFIRALIGEYSKLLIATSPMREKDPKQNAEIRTDNSIIIRILGVIFILVAFTGLIVRFQ